MLSEKEYLNTKDVARYLAISPDTLRRWRWQGKGPKYQRLSYRTVRYTKDAIDQWIQDQARPERWERVS